MKLRNKKTGDIVDIADLDFTSDNFAIWLSTTKYSSLAELNEEWEDYEEPKEYWYVNDLDGKPMKCELRYCPIRYFTEWSEKRKQIGNYFETKEEAEKAVEKLKAWKRLKCEVVGWSFSYNLDVNGCEFNDEGIVIGIKLPGGYSRKDLDFLFGGKK